MPKLSEYRIVIAKNAPYRDRREATYIKNYIRLVTGASLDIVTDDTTPADCEIVVGETSREILDGLDFERHLCSWGLCWSFEIKYHKKRLYLTGLGRFSCSDENEKFWRLGSFGTDIASKVFAERVLGYKNIYSPYDSFTEKEDIEIDESCNIRLHQDEHLCSLPPLFKGTSMYSIQGRSGSMNCFILRTRSGKLVVIDGGMYTSTDHVMRVLTHLSDGKTPTVDAWFISHIHPDHYGVYCQIVKDGAIRDKIEIKNLYYNILSKDYYTKIAPNSSPIFDEIYDIIENSDKTFGVNKIRVEKNDIIKLDELEFRIFHVPDKNSGSETDINDSSIVFRMTVDGEQSVFFLSDGEHFANEDLLENHADEIKSDMVQMGHHGFYSVSRKCYEKIGAKKYLFPTDIKSWYNNSGRGSNSGWGMLNRTRSIVRDLGATADDIYNDALGILSFEFPIDLT